ncbi:hypothetical protein [Pseudodesulfovibrio indicus]|uniref:DUF4238 domain-containing protein n=2 Tax=Pseudodesulfovibrio indicus TaxID=1716143 RepID=A0AA94PKN6_9BACT|nr:hypothetical protein [Pseudodesulfovibrio indicus]TDT87943.1 hypothetical protein EDC59_107138 [Pseudodesulfovibrio indicus]
MAGSNQHYIPQFFQKGFAVAGSDETKIWKITTAKWLPTKPGPIKSTASDDSFYSRTVDDEITNQENEMARIVRELREKPVGTEVDPEVAAGVLAHFSPRTAHIRDVFEWGMREVVTGAERLFSDGEQVKRLAGIDQREPNDAFRTNVMNLLRENEMFASLPLPNFVVERIAFYLAKEQFETNFNNNLPSMKGAISQLLDNAGEAARSGHNKALANLDGPNKRRAFLESLSWKIVAGPPEGTILPDCVALALDHTGTVTSFMLAKFDDCLAVMMPLDKDVLLLGTSEEGGLPSTFDFNKEAARASHSFFLSSTKSDRIEALWPLIGERSTCIVDEAVKSGLERHTTSPLAADSEEDGARVAPGSDIQPATTPSRSYQVSFIGCADETTAKMIARETEQLVKELGRFLPLNRLDGITFAADYPEALQKIDRGKPGLKQPTTIDRDVGIGFGQNVLVVRDEVVMGRIVTDSSIGNAIISKNEQQVLWAIGLMSKLLVNVALTEMIDVALQGLLLQPIPDHENNTFYTTVDGVAEEYISTYMCATLGNSNEKTDDHRQLLTEALIGMRETVLSARHAYRYDGDLDILLEITLSKIRHVLFFAAGLLGHTGGLGVEAVPPRSELEDALVKTGLKLWLPIYKEDLEKFRLRLGRWESFNEFAAFNVHIERLMWQLGMIPWKTDEGMRVEIPIGSDAEVLMADLTASGLKGK